MLPDSGATSTSLSCQRTQTPLKPHLSYKRKTGMKMVSECDVSQIIFVNSLIIFRNGERDGTIQDCRGWHRREFQHWLDHRGGGLLLWKLWLCCFLCLLSLSRAFIIWIVMMMGHLLSSVDENRNDQVRPTGALDYELIPGKWTEKVFPHFLCIRF